MAMPYRARLDERRFLNLPGFGGAARIWVYVEDTDARELACDPYCDGDCAQCPRNFEPRMILEISDGESEVSLGFDVDLEEGRMNSLYKIDTLISALRLFRSAVTAEFEPYDRRRRQLENIVE
jgi:hypothetical protein